MVVKGALEQIVDEMDAALFRSALSSVISQGHDASHGIYHPVTGETMVQGRLGLPIFVGTMQATVRAVIEDFGDQMQPGDAYLLNDPYRGGTHLQDLKVVRPVFVDGEIFCYLASVAHAIDIGGPIPGGFNSAASTHFQEGLFIGPVRLATGDVINEDVLNLLRWNTRKPDWTAADVRCQLNSLRLGETRLRALLGKYGTTVVSDVFGELVERAERVMRSHIDELPDGAYTFRDYMDNDGKSPDRSLLIDLVMTVAGSDLTLDFSGSESAVDGPVNISRPTLHAACFVALKHLFPDAHANAGCMRPVQVIAPDDTIVTARKPTSVGGYLEVTTRVIDLVFGAVAEADPGLAYAGSYGSVNQIVIASDAAKDPFVMFTWFGGGLGASARGAGLTHGPGPISTAVMQPVEMLESRYPIVFDEWAIRDDSAGDGVHRGGDGSVYRIRLTAETARLSVMGDRGRFAPFGIAGGQAGKPNEIEVVRADGDRESLPMVSKGTDIPLKRGDSIVIRSGGGGGWGEAR
jgi:N-methylhydantoinase B